MSEPLASLQWCEPVEVTRWRWQQINGPFCRKSFVHLAKLTLIASIPRFCSRHRVDARTTVPRFGRFAFRFVYSFGEFAANVVYA